MSALEPTGRPPARIWGLEQIAARLGISRRTLIRLLARPPGERPPVRRCHRGWYALESRLQDWVDAEDMDGGVALTLDAQRAHHAQSGTATLTDGLN